MSTFEIACEHCGSRYAVPYQFREALRGRDATCSVCARDWIPLPSDPRSGEAVGPPGGAPVNLHAFLLSNPIPMATPARGVDPMETPRVRSSASGASANLRVVASGPSLHHEAVHALEGRAFLIGAEGCHLDLPLASDLPARAIRITADGDGLRFEGVGGFAVPIGPISVADGRLLPGKRLDLVLGAYLVELEATAAPGRPVPDLEGGAGGPGPVAPPSAPAPPADAAPAPVDVNSTVRGLSALGFHTSRRANPLDGIDVGFVGLDAPFAGEWFWISKSPALIGRAAGDVRLGDSRVSGKHAQLDVLDVDQYALKDLASTNGTTVNGRPVSTTRLRDGDEVSFGGVRLRFAARRKERA